MSEVNLDQAQAVEEAENAGCEVIKRGMDCLMLDLDGKEALQYFTQHWHKVLQDFHAFAGFTVEDKGLVAWRSKSGRGVHVGIKFDAELPTLAHVLLLQAVMGSDRTRDFLSLMRNFLGQEDPRLLFRPKKGSDGKLNRKYVGQAQVHWLAHEVLRELTATRDAYTGTFDDDDDIF